MSSQTEQPEREALRALLTGVERVEFGEVDLEAAVAAYTKAGYEVTDHLREFLKNYGEIVVGWTSPRTGEEMVLSVTLEEAMDVYPPNVRSYSRQLGMKAVPVGVAMETEENVLLVENGDIVFAGDAGMQRVGNGFEEAVKAFVSSTWDKTFF
ncbi:SUKH-3 domain-containing protein [Streptomyces sp. NPDC060209]|uniref:SUKH-3 domain-containing protein n=1 Tax=Streptomyces sp. NPDC060209 TaxID=3347073 RepID=UPI00365604F0